MSAWVRIWDVGIWILVVFPLLTGGVWIQRPGLKVELVELAVPVLLMSFFTLVLAKKSKADLTQSSSYRSAAKLWNSWRKILLAHPNSALIGGSFGIGSIWTLAAWRRHWAYGSCAADLGIFTSAIWNLTHGQGYLSSVKNGANLFTDHQSPIFWTLAPLFKIFPSAETLLIFQALGLALGAWSLYQLAVQYLPRNHWATAALPWIYWALPAVRTANLFDFHPEVISLPLVLGSVALLQDTGSRKIIWGVVLFLLALACKESGGGVAFGLGLAWALGAAPKKSRARMSKMGLFLMPFGMALFLFQTHWIPKHFGFAYGYQGQYQQYGENFLDLVSAPIVKPRLFWTALINPARLKFLFWLLAPLGFLPLISWRIAVSALPSLFMLLLSKGDHRVSTGYYYGVEPSIGLLWSLPLGLQILDRKKFGRYLPYWMMFWCLVCFGRSEIFRIRFHQPSDHHKWLTHSVIPCLHPTASFSVSSALVPHISNRHWTHDLPQITRPTPSGTSLVDCVIYDPLINNWPLSLSEAQALKELPGYEVISECHGLRVFQRKTPDEDVVRCLTCPICFNNDKIGGTDLKESF